LLLCAACAAIPPVSGWTAQPSPDPEIVITVTRSANSLSNVNASVLTVDREQIEASQAYDIAELLRVNAGFDIGRNGGPGQTASLFLRGAESNHTLVLIDGVKVNDGAVGQAALNNIRPDMIERVEVVKGPRSALYGSEAIGGVVQIFTRRAEPGTQWGLMAGGGKDRTREFSANVQHRAGAWRGGVDLSGFATDGFPARTDASENSGNDNITANAYVGWSGPVDIELRHWQATGNTEYYSFDLMPLDQDFRNAVTALSLAGDPAANWHSKLVLSHTQDKIDQNQNDDFTHTTRWVADWQNDLHFSESDLVIAGLTLSREDAASLSFGTGFDTSTDAVEGYLQWQRHAGDHDFVAAVRVSDHEGFGTEPTGELSWGWRVVPAIRLRLAAASGYRAPGAADRFGFGGNPDLKPEKSRNLEAGAVWTPGPMHRVEVNMFRNDIDDLITFSDPDGFDGPVPGRNENIDRARITGIELRYRFERSAWWLDAAAVWQDPEDRATGAQLPRRAKQSYSLSAGFKRSGYRVGAEVVAVGERPDSSFSDVINDAYVLVNLNAQKQLSRRWLARARIENLFNEDYVLASGFNTQGRAAYIQVVYAHP